MSAANFPVRSLDAAGYGATFAVLLRHSLEYGPMGQAVADRLRDIAAGSDAGWRLLDVGAGDGGLIGGLLADLPACGRWLALEPDRPRFEALRERQAACGLPPHVIGCRQLAYEAAAIAELANGIESGAEQPFHMVLFSHSLYWLPRPIELLEASLGLLADGGMLLVLHQGPFGCWQLHATFAPLLQRDRPTGPDHGLHGLAIAQALRARGHAVSLEYLPGGFDVTGIMGVDGAEERHALISFALQIEWASVPGELREDLDAWFRAAVVTDGLGRTLWHQPTTLVTVRS
jgi:SAM-dependent methyltransferase